MKTNLLKSRMIAAGYNTTTLLKALEDKGAKMCKSAWYRKISGETEFTRSELDALAKLLNLDATSFADIFLSN